MSDAAAVAVIPEAERNLRGLELAERHFPMERRQQVAAYLDVPADSPAMLPFLAFCASLNLSPISGLAWLIPTKTRSADGGGETTVYRIAIGRDGLLQKARETRGQPGGYMGMKFNVVCARDTFEVEDSADFASAPRVLHRFASKPSTFEEGEDPELYRGPVIGAWACCYVDGEPPTFYYANLREHGQQRHAYAWDPAKNAHRLLFVGEDGEQTFEEFGPGNVQRPPVMEWAEAWTYLSTMVLKAAQSYVLRIALGITGVVPVDEIRDLRGQQDVTNPGLTTGTPVDVDAFRWESIADEDLREALHAAVDTANAAEPFAWGPAKCEMVFTGRSADELGAILMQISLENALREARALAVASAPAADGEAIAVLRRRRELLAAARETAPEGQQNDVIAELDQVEAELREALGLEPGADLG